MAMFGEPELSTQLSIQERLNIVSSYLAFCTTTSVLLSIYIHCLVGLYFNILLITNSILKNIMSINTPIFTIAKDLNVESNRILLACKKLGINAKGATKRLSKEELEKIKSYFETGKNVSDEVINLNKVKNKNNSRKIAEKVKIKYFANRLIRKS